MRGALGDCALVPHSRLVVGSKVTSWEGQPNQVAGAAGRAGRKYQAIAGSVMVDNPGAVHLIH